MAENFGEAFISGQESAQQQQMNASLIQQGAQTVQMNQQKIQQTQLMLERTEAYIRELNRLNGSKNTPGSTPTTPQDLVRDQANLQFQMADLARHQGLFEESQKEAELGGKLAQNAAVIDWHEAEAARNKAQYAANVMQHALEAKDPQEFERRFRTGVMGYQETFKEQSRFAQVQPSRQLAETIAAAATSKKDQAEMDMHRAQTAHDYAGARAESARAAFQEYQLKQEKELDESLTKEGDKNESPGRIINAVAGALKSRGISVPGGWSGKAVAANTRPFIADHPRRPGEALQDYAERVGDEVVASETQAKSQIAGGTAAARTAGTRVGGIEPALEAMIGKGPPNEKGYADNGVIGQYVEAARDMDFSSFKGFTITQQGYAQLTGDPNLDRYALKANALASEYAQVVARGGKGAVADREHALDLIAKQKSPARAEIIALSLLEEARAAQSGGREALKTLTRPGGATAEEGPTATDAQGNKVQWNGKAKAWVPVKK